MRQDFRRRRRERNQAGWVVATPGGKWQAHWMEYPLDPATGKTRLKHRSKIVGEVGKMTQAKAEKDLRRIVEPLNEKTGAQPDARMTFGAFYDNHFRPLKEGKWGPATRYNNQTDMRNYIRPALGHVALEDIDYPMLQMLINRMADDGYCVDVVKRCKVRVSSVLKEAVKLRFLAANPALFVDKPVCKATRKPVLTKEQLLSLWRAVARPGRVNRYGRDTSARDSLILRIGTLCALTASELFALTWECVTPKTLIIRSTVWKGKLYEYRVKKKSRMRAVPVPREIYNGLLEWKAECERAAGQRGLHSRFATPQTLVFPGDPRRRRNEEGKLVANVGPMWAGTFLTKHIRPIADTLGILEPVTFQVLRRSFATWNQKELKVTQGVMGHSRVETTANVYAQEVPQSGHELVAQYYSDIKRAKTKRPKAARELLGQDQIERAREITRRVQ